MELVHVKCRQGHKAMELIRQMQQEGVYPERATNQTFESEPQNWTPNPTPTRMEVLNLQQNRTT